MLSFPGYTNYSVWQNASSTIIISQLSVLLTYIEGRQMVAPKLLNIHFESHWVLFGKNENVQVTEWCLVNAERSVIRFGNRTGCQCPVGQCGKIVIFAIFANFASIGNFYGPLHCFVLCPVGDWGKLSFSPYLPNSPVSTSFMGPFIALCFALLAKPTRCHKPSGV